MANENKIPEIIKSSMENIRSMVDANTIIGDPVNATGGTVIIPISKVSVGIASGGVDYGTKKDAQIRPQNFGGGGGTGISVVPVAFISIDAEGEAKILSMDAPVIAAPEDTVSKIISVIDRSPELIEKIKSIFSKQ
jgi:sporulation protein YtfJ